MIIKSIKKSVVRVGALVWVRYDPKMGQSQCGDYGYLKAYTKNRNECEIDGLIYVYGKIIDISCNYGAVKFAIDIGGYTVGVREPERLFLDHD